MKKIILFTIFTFVFTSVFSGCGIFGSNNNVNSIAGILSEQKIGDEYPGSHLIEDEKGKIYPLNSTVLNLSGQQYIGNKVQVNVEYDETNKIYRVSGVSVLEVLEKESGKANWTSYMNQDVGFRFKYYDDWTVSEKNGLVDFTSPLRCVGDDCVSPSLSSPDRVAITRYNKEKDVAVSDFAGEKMALLENFDKFRSSDAKIGADQQSAIKYSSTGSRETYFFVERSPYVYEITFVPNENFNDTNERTFYEMLLEFRFVPFDEETLAVTDDSDEEDDVSTDAEVNNLQDDAPVADDKPLVNEPVAVEPVAVGGIGDSYDYSSFSEFESLPYHFSAKYPAGWYYAGTSGVEDGVLHKYAFSDKPVDSENEFASLKVLSSELPAGTSVSVANGTAVKKILGEDVYFYVKVSGRVYCVQGKKTLEDVLLQIASSITPVSN